MQTDKTIVLDTHVWVWLMNGDDRLNDKAILKTISNAASAGLLRVSAISVWEVAMLVSKERLKLSMPVDEWVEKALAVPGIRLAPIEPLIAIDSTRLPGEFHGDSSDRIIVATTRSFDGVLITADKAIIRYGKERFLAVVQVGKSPETRSVTGV